MNDPLYAPPPLRTAPTVEPLVPVELPAWLASMFVHMAIIVGLGTLWIPQPPNFRGPVLEASLAPPPAEEPETKLEVKQQEFELKPSELPEIGSARTVGQEVDVSTAMAVAVP